jgi:hypothetical protein
MTKLVEIKKKINSKKVVEKIKNAEFESLEHALATIRKSVVHSIRRGKPNKDGINVPSKPGKPPKSWGNHGRTAMKRAILYKIERDKKNEVGTVYITPDDAGDRIYQVHEKGGTKTNWVKVQNERKSKYIDRLAIEGHMYRGGMRSWRRSGGRNAWYRILPDRERSQAELDAIKKWYIDGETYAEEKQIKKSVSYPARPFMRPALEKNQSKLPRKWLENIQDEIQ